MPETRAPQVHRGLAGVVADDTAVSKVMPETNSLTYRGYPVQDLADLCRFEEVAYLLLHGDLPTRAQLDQFTAAERTARELTEGLHTVIAGSPSGAHPMDLVRTAVSFLGAEDPAAASPGSPPTRDQAVRLLAKLPTIVAAIHRHQHGHPPIRPNPELGLSENFFSMCFGRPPKPEVVRAFDVSLTLYAEHGFNASTFAARVVTSTLSDFYSAVVAAIGALKGPLHGGANEAVMRMLLEIGEPDRARLWLGQSLDRGDKIMGFGHRVYRDGDSRVPTMKRHLDELAEATGGRRWLEMEAILEQGMLEAKRIHPNLDFPSGPAYHLMGFDTSYFTPIFVMARLPGWGAHILEQSSKNKLVRPLAKYIGAEQRDVVSIEERR